MLHLWPHLSPEEGLPGAQGEAEEAVEGGGGVGGEDREGRGKENAAKTAQNINLH